jgi:anaerobic selenocysteine-containing dehydrogenase
MFPPSRLLKKQMTAAFLFSTRPVGSRSTDLNDARLASSVADRRPPRICVGSSEAIASHSCDLGREVSDPNQVVSGQRKRKHPVDPAGAPVPRLAHEPDRLQPERVSEITGIPVADIVRLTREYATTQPSVIRIGVAIERHSGGGQCVRAISCLPALVGAWRRPGGGLLQMPVWAFPLKWDGLMRPDFIRPGTRIVNQFRLGPALTGELGLVPAVKALFVYNSNPAVVVPEQDKVVAGLIREDLFTVVSEQFMTDTAELADIVPPATTQLEQFDIMFSWGHLYLSLNMPAIAPLGEAIPNTELFRRLAARMGFEDKCFKRTDEQMALEALDWSSPALTGIDLELLKRNGYARLKVGMPDTFAPHAEGNFPTPSGKCEFVSSLAPNGNFVLPLFRQGSNEFQPGEPVDPLPRYIHPVSHRRPTPHGPAAIR